MYTNYVVDFNRELSQLTLTERPNSLFEFPEEALHHHDSPIMPSEFDNSEIINSYSSRHNRSSSSGPASGVVRHSLTADGVKCASSHQETFCTSQSSSAAVGRSFDTIASDLMSQQKPTETLSVKSWAAVLAIGKKVQQPVLASAVKGRQTDQQKLSRSLSTRNTPVNHHSESKLVTHPQANSMSRSTTRVGDQTQVLSSDSDKNRTKSSDRISVKRSDAQLATWTTVSSHDSKSKSRLQTRQSHNDVSIHLAGSCADVKPKQDKQDDKSTEISAAAAASPGSNSKTIKQKKKKKKKSKGSDIALEETPNPVERMEISQSHPAPEFNNLNEFPFLFSLSSFSKKTPVHAAISSYTVNMPNTSGIFSLCIIDCIYVIHLLLLLPSMTHSIFDCRL